MHTRLTAAALGVLLTLPAAACTARDDISPSATGPVRIGFITKFPGDFYDTMASAARTFDAQHNDVEITFDRARAAPTTKARSASSTRSPRKR